MKLKLLLLSLSFVVMSLQGHAQEKKTMPKYFSGKDGVAIQGYDVVNYHSQNSAAQGFEKFSVEYDNTVFYFKDKANQKTFKKNPEKYLPEYNGYCAFGLGKAQKQFPVDPESFKVVDGKLYLFFHGPIQGKMTNTLDLWNMDEVNLMNAADKAWETIENKEK